MKRVALTLIILLATISNISAQLVSSYSKGDSLLELNQYDAAISEYKALLKSGNPLFRHVYYYNLACAYSLMYQLDSSIDIFMNTPKLTQNAEFIFDIDLSNLHTHESWQVLIDRYKHYFLSTNAQYPEFETAFDLSLMKEEGQAIRRAADRKSGSRKYQDSIIARWRIIDSINTLKLVKIIDRMGWPDNSKVGSKGALNAFIILQHSPLEVQKKYVSLLKKAVSENKASLIHLAYIEDRILTLENKLQIYGTQIDVTGSTPKPYPVIDPDNLDKRRKSIGLEPIDEYLKQFN